MYFSMDFSYKKLIFQPNNQILYLLGRSHQGALKLEENNFFVLHEIVLKNKENKFSRQGWQNLKGECTVLCFIYRKMNLSKIILKKCEVLQ